VQFIDADADADADASICLGNEFRDYSPLILEMSWFGIFGFVCCNIKRKRYFIFNFRPKLLRFNAIFYL